jgi:hypothetical protein
MIELTAFSHHHLELHVCAETCKTDPLQEILIPNLTAPLEACLQTLNRISRHMLLLCASIEASLTCTGCPCRIRKSMADGVSEVVLREHVQAQDCVRGGAAKVSLLLGILRNLDGADCSPLHTYTLRSISPFQKASAACLANKNDLMMCRYKACDSMTATLIEPTCGTCLPCMHQSNWNDQ